MKRAARTDKFPQMACVTRPVPHQVKAMMPIANQLRKAGYRVRETFDRCPTEHILFCWGNGWAKEIRATRGNAVRICVMDHGLFHPRKKYVVTGWEGLNGWGEHPVIDYDFGHRLTSKGWDQLVLPPRQFTKPRDGYALILGQVYGDAAIVDGVQDYGTWLRELAESLSSPGWEVRFRPHPVQARGDVNRYPNVGHRTDHSKSIYEDFDGAAMVVAMNSNGLLDAFLHGVQDVRLFNEGSMQWPISQPVEDGMPGERKAAFGKREALAQRLAWCQWDPDEIEDGEWIKYHAPIMERVVLDNEVRPWYNTSI